MSYRGGKVIRYIYYILIIIFGITLYIGYQFKANLPAPKELVVQVNDHAITQDQFEKEKATHINCFKDKKEVMDSLIIRELLIQEARQAGIDREEEFRETIQDFYEQSLIKLLMDRKFNSLDIQVSEEELDRYLELLGKQVELSLFHFAAPEAAEQSPLDTGKKLKADFANLSKELKHIVMGHQVGSRTAPIPMATGAVVVYRLDKIDDVSLEVPPDISRKKARQILTQGKREMAVNAWLAGLRNQACVTVCPPPPLEGTAPDHHN